MHPGAECVGEYDTLADAARTMRERGVGALPICGDDQKLLGILTDRDIVLKCVAEGSTRTGSGPSTSPSAVRW
ncbi:CBS domain-containing protein [Kitasatospora paranensis]|uniref:CBS domain-containing protein n=1 Tax=Kitasatospora paranensis TaxID=258053 RepID=UPI0031EE1031